MLTDLQIGLALKSLRESRGLTARELSHRAGLPEYTVSRIETGKLSLDFFTSARLAVELDVTLEKIAETAKALPPEVLETGAELHKARIAARELRKKVKILNHSSDASG